MRVLIVGELDGYASLAAKTAFDQGARVIQVQNATEALITLRQGRGADLALVDVKLNLASFIKQLESEHFSLPIVACGISLNAEQASEAIMVGAKEYLPLPPNADLISAILSSISYQDAAFIYEDRNIKKMMNMIEKIAPSDANVLITGESGTGKEVISRHIHQKSKRSSKPFIAINCAAIPDNLLESELFGHEKGAFTGAVARRIGKFEEANGGTLLLDEVTEMDLRLQAKLLRALQERTIDRVGGSSCVPINIRVIATSNRKIQDAIKVGIFREDLYFRLNVIPVHIPPLRERVDDIIPLSHYFVEKYSKLNGVQKKTFSQESLRHIQTYSWPGNVRELENRMHRAILLSCQEEIEVDDLFEEPIKEVFQNKKLSDIEKEMIFDTLKTCQGNRTHAASVLGISIRTLRNKLKEYEETDTSDVNVKKFEML